MIIKQDRDFLIMKNMTLQCLVCDADVSNLCLSRCTALEEYECYVGQSEMGEGLSQSPSEMKQGHTAYLKHYPDFWEYFHNNFSVFYGKELFHGFMVHRNHYLLYSIYKVGNLLLKTLFQKAIQQPNEHFAFLYQQQ